MIAATRFVVGTEALTGPDDHLIALDLHELRTALSSGVPSTSFHELFDDPVVKPAREIVINVPIRRGYRFVELLEWLVCGILGEPETTQVLWRAPRKGGAGGVERILTARGWKLSRSKRGRTVELTGYPPPIGDPPVPNSFVAALAGRHLRFCADWGVFSAQHLDEGTLLLFDVAAEDDPVPLVVDVGTGYGPLALGLTVAGRAAQAVVTEVDAVALALALRNARAAGVSMRGLLEDNPIAAPKSDLTVCNFPTHLQRDRSDRLLRGLCQRAAFGRVLVVVHASLESRFVRRFAEESVCTEVVRRSAHSVLALMPSDMRPFSS